MPPACGKNKKGSTLFLPQHGKIIKDQPIESLAS
nr:MAG TPA: hypothetical protein [Caudoviricetes sp.]